MKTKREGYILIAILIFINLAAAGWLIYVKMNLKECQNSESFGCPSFQCPVPMSNPDSKCGNRPYRCSQYDKGHYDCSEKYKVCQDNAYGNDE